MAFLFSGTIDDATEKHDTLIWFYRHIGLMPGRASKVLIRGF
jgi:hypothetical protein